MENNHVFGAVFSPVDVRDYILVASAVQANFPEEFELEMGVVKDQKTVGSCVAHSLSEIVEYFEKNQNNRVNVMSTEYIYGNRKSSSWKGPGMIIRDALENVRLYGDLLEADAPGNLEVPSAIDKYNSLYNNNKCKEKSKPNRISNYYRVKSEYEIKTALMNNGPVLFAVMWYNDARVTSNGVLISNRNPNQSCGGHCMVIYGWNQQGWLVRNSWSTSWGKNGNCILPYNYPIVEAWGIIDDIKDTPEMKRPFTKNKISECFAKIINKFRNIFKKH